MQIQLCSVRPESPETLVASCLYSLFPICTQIKTIEQFKNTFSIKSKTVYKTNKKLGI